MTATDLETGPGSVTAELSILDRFLPIWIGLAMAIGLGLGRLIPDLDTDLERVKLDTVSLPIALGLFAMMYPVLAKVRYRHIGDELADRRTLGLSLVLNWIIGPLLMFTLAWLFLADLPELRTGLIIVGLARCIAMVLIWNDLACGSRELAAVLVAVNSLFQIVMYSVLGWFYLSVLPGWLGLDTADLHVSLWSIARSVLIFLGIPLLAGFLTRTVGEARKGTDWYENTFLPRIGPVALYGLLFTIVVLFALQGDQITNHPLDVARVAIPLLVYFALMWTGSFTLGYRLHFPYAPKRVGGLHRRGQQLRARDRRVDRRVRRDLWPSPRGNHRSAHRSTRARRARLRVAVGEGALLCESAFDARRLSEGEQCVAVGREDESRLDGSIRVGVVVLLIVVA